MMLRLSIAALLVIAGSLNAQEHLSTNWKDMGSSIFTYKDRSYQPMLEYKCDSWIRLFTTLERDPNDRHVAIVVTFPDKTTKTWNIQWELPKGSDAADRTKTVVLAHQEVDNALFNELHTAFQAGRKVSLSPTYKKEGPKTIEFSLGGYTKAARSNCQ